MPNQKRYRNETPLKPLAVGTPIYYFDESILRIRKSTIYRTPFAGDCDIAVNVSGSYQHAEYAPIDFVALRNDKDLKDLIKYVGKHLGRVNNALHRKIIKNVKALERLDKHVKATK